MAWGGWRVGSGRRTLLTTLSTAIALTMALSLVTEASAATVSNAWRAKIGTGGVNGTATISAYTSGTGSIVLKLAKLKASTSQPVSIRRGTCSGATVLTLPSIKTSSAGAASRTSSLSASQVTAIKNATKTGRIAIRVGSSTTGGVKCGTFAALAVAPYVAATITVGIGPSDVAITPTGVWVTNWEGSVSRIDPATNNVLQTLPLTISGLAVPEAIAYGENSLWVTVTSWDSAGNSTPGSLLRVDPATGVQQATIPTGRGPFKVAVSPGAVWVPLFDDNQVLRVDPATGAVATTIPVAGNPADVVFAFGSVWVSSWDGHLTRIDPATNQVIATIMTQDSGGDVTASANAIWMANVGHSTALDGQLTRVDPATNQVVASVRLSLHPIALKAAGGSVWVGCDSVLDVIQVSEATNTLVRSIAIANVPYALAADDHNVWVAESTSQPAAGTPWPQGHVTRIVY